VSPAVPRRLADEPGELIEALARRAPGVAPKALRGAAEAALGSVAENVEAGLDREGLPGLFPGERSLSVSYRPTLTLPYPIERANSTCAVGDTATWEFSDEDLYGRGLGMWATASAPPPASAVRP
jgi:hypothetical protein